MTRILHVTLAAAVVAAALQPAPAPEPTVAAATARLQAQDPAGAVGILESIIAHDATNVQAWRVLGVAYQRAHDLDRALAANRRAHELTPAWPPTMYNIGVVYALKHDADAAVEWLGKAKATRKLDMTQLETDADVASLQGDARFAALLPAASDFADPFVEPVKIMREWDGEARGRSVRLDCARRGRRRSRWRAGRRHLRADQRRRRRRGGTRVRVLDEARRAAVERVEGMPGDQLGIGVEGAGDTNHDGMPDVIASAPGAGKAYVYSGKDGRVLLTLKARGRATASAATSLASATSTATATRT